MQTSEAAEESQEKGQEKGREAGGGDEDSVAAEDSAGAAAFAAAKKASSASSGFWESFRSTGSLRTSSASSSRELKEEDGEAQEKDAAIATGDAFKAGGLASYWSWRQSVRQQDEAGNTGYWSWRQSVRSQDDDVVDGDTASSSGPSSSSSSLTASQRNSWRGSFRNISTSIRSLGSFAELNQAAGGQQGQQDDGNGTSVDGDTDKRKRLSEVDEEDTTAKE